MRLAVVEEPPRTAGIRISCPPQSEKTPHPEKRPCIATLAEVATRQRFRQGVFTRPRPVSTVRGNATTAFFDGLFDGRDEAHRQVQICGDLVYLRSRSAQTRLLYRA
jgi:hypothetical protein